MAGLNTSKIKYYFLFIPIIGILSGCLGTNHLKTGEKLLVKQSIKAPKRISSSDLKNLYTQEPNQRFPPLVPIYYLGKRSYHPEKFEKKIEATNTKFDTKIANAKTDRKANHLQFRKQRKLDKYNDRLQNGNLLMQWGEPLAVYDSIKHQQTLERFHEYLFAKGYFNNKVTATVSGPKLIPINQSKLINVSYKVEPGTPYIIDSIFFRVTDSLMLSLLKNKLSDSYLQVGARYDQANFTQERERIDLLMKDNGYYDFSRQYIEFDVDTTRGNHTVVVSILIKEPAKRGYHKQFKIDEVNFTTDAGVSLTGVERKSKRYRDIDYQYYDDNYNLKILSQRVFILPGQLFSRTSTFNTQRQLANLDNFKFVNINYDTSGGQFVANIFASPLERYQWSNEVGVSVTQGFPGPFYNINFRKRNIFNGLENFELNGRIGFEGVASATNTENIYRSTEAGINSSITFPQFLWPFSDERRYKFGKLNPRTRAQLGYSYTDRPEYKRSATTINYTYSWDNQRIRRFDLTLASLSIINSDVTPEFGDLLNELRDNGNTLYLSFRSSFVSSIIFSMTWNHNNYGNLEENSVFFRWSLESGGTLQNLIDYPIIENRGLQSFRYIRASADIRRINVLTKSITLAYRFNAGVGYAYDNQGALPYEKYFFAGGSNSIRAWRPRRVGPGSYRPNLSSDPTADGLYDYRFEQPGDVLLEASVELRRKLIGFVEGAIFIDAGNVWTLQPLIKRDTEGNQIENGNSDFRPDQFYKEIAVGTGFGFRFNFSFLILRIDVGIKAWDPARPEGDRFVLNKMKFFKPFGTEREPVIFNVGIGYPF